MLTMAHRLATMRATCMREIDIDASDSAIKCHRQDALNSPLIDCNEIHSYMKSLCEDAGKDGWVLSEFPILIPPLSPCVFSFDETNTASAFLQYGAVLHQIDTGIISLFVDKNGIPIRDVAWGFSLATYVVPRFGYGQGRPAWTGSSVHVLCDQPGKPMRAWCQLNGEPQGPLQDDDIEELSYSIAVVVFMAISFLHCKNVAKCDVTAEVGPPAKWLRRQKCPEIKCYTLDIGPMKQVLRTEGGIETNGLKKALHICRGHFAHYTDENPLFGRITGTFWKPQHVRGSKEFGEVKKDYRVKV